VEEIKSKLDKASMLGLSDSEAKLMALRMRASSKH